MDDPIVRAKRLMQQTCKRPPPIEQLCEKIGLPSHTFRRRFRKAEGMTPSEYIQKLRQQEVERLLRETDLRVFEIAYDFGFSDESNFSHWFYRRTSQWPTEYRKRHQHTRAR
ncbi:helix-turn-helix transcriptional regulator [candidate division KSB1 bacterium]|nr:helix-turn-helix transcriptional regulator [candidate division KSB1 bacterium]NIR72625.1 helix-turn-helix transcriptional regulator [candidate division KSB1 bacterium]NIS27336.1 helix-turn-helix transcriptional regulator [candidate division KSB1 bacterium]NIT73549.1 helix-turn-helix transcriptional regulator [candidate division KSB1 bacterium]NIU25397.1 helix-turn-helix transcriptional regulator [candidate division KSB1 bacterium]